MCHYTESPQKMEISIKVAEEEIRKELPPIEIYRVSASGVIKVPNLDSKFSYLVADRKSSTIWIWKGAKCSPGDAYKAGVESTKLKSSLKFYNANIIRIEEGDEPETFPKIGAELEAKERDRLKKEEEDLKDKEEKHKRKEEEASRRKDEEALKRQEDESQKRRYEDTTIRRYVDTTIRRDEEARKRKEEEHKRKIEEEERKLKQEEALLRKEGDERRLKEENERRLKEEDERRTIEKERITTEVLQESAPEVKPPPEVEEERDISKDTELKEAVSSLTLVRGITKEIAMKLYKANISTIMELSLSDPENLAASGISLTSLQEIIRNAKDLLGLD